jgi:hypothetical protein
MEAQTMTFIGKFILVTKMTVLSLFLSITNKDSYLVYLNSPETVKSSGLIYSQTFNKNSKVRYFFHYKNGTKNPMNFVIKANNKLENLKKSINTDFRPEIAGAKSGKSFMESMPKQSFVNYSSSVLPGCTISGILEADFEKNDYIEYYFDNKNEITKFDVLQDNYIFNHSYSINSNSTVSYRLGDNEDNTVKGLYGSDINIKITPKDSGILKLTFSPRGGSGLLVFSNKGKIYTTKLCDAKSYNEVFVCNVEKNISETFTFIPIGGLNYPILLNFSLHSFENTKVA